MGGGRALAQAEISRANLFAIVGADRFLRSEALREVLTRLGDDADRSGAVRFDGDGVSAAEVLDEVRTPSLLGDRRIVVVDDADGFISAHRAVLERYCASPGDDGALLLLCDSLPKNTRLYKIIAKQGEVIVCEAPRGRAVAAWLVQRAKTAYGKRIAFDAAERLREQLGDAPGMLDAELCKLATYVGPRGEISSADIEALSGSYREEKVFVVTDAMAEGRVEDALRAWEQVLATDRAATGRAIAGLAWGVRRLLEARRELDAGVPVNVLARKLFADPVLAKRRLSGFTVRQLETQQRELLAADVAVKTGLATVECSVERFIVAHSAGRAPAAASRG